LAAGFCQKNLAFARKLMALPESGGLQTPPAPPGSYAYENGFFRAGRDTVQKYGISTHQSCSDKTNK